MNNILKNELNDLLEKYRKSRAFENGEIGSHRDDQDSKLVYKILGAANIVMSFAHKTDDLELLGFSTKIQLNLLKDIDEEAESYDQYRREQEDEHNFMMSIHKFCSDIFYTQNRYYVDMSKYSDIVEDSHKLLENVRVKNRLINYIDEKRVLNKIYVKVRDSIMLLDIKILPEISIVDAMFTSELKEIYRLADIHIPFQIDKS